MTKVVRKLAKVVMTFSILFGSQMLFGQNNLEQQISELLDMAEVAIQVDYDQPLADSLSRKAVDLANTPTGSEDLLYLAVTGYLTRGGAMIETNVDDKYLSIAIDMLNRDITKAQKLELRLSLVPCLLNKGDVERAEDFAVRALADAVAIEDPLVKIKVNLAMADVMLQKGQHVQAYEYLLNARKFLLDVPSEERNQQALVTMDMACLIRQDLADLEQALEVKLDQIELVGGTQPVDSVMYFKLWLDYCQIVTVSNLDDKIEDIINKAEYYGLRNDNHHIFQRSRSILMSRLINTEQWERLKEEFFDRYNFPINSVEDSLEIAKLCMGKGMFCAVDNNIDSARFFFSRAIELSESDDNNHGYTANFARRYAQVLHRNNFLDEAYLLYQKSLKYARLSKWESVIIQSAQALDTLAIALYGDYEAAYRYKSIMNETQNSLADQQRLNDIAIMHIDHEKEQEKRLEQEYKEKYRKKRNIQYFGIGVGLIILFIIFIIVSSLAVPNWLINMLGFFSVLFVFEFAILILDNELHDSPWVYGNTVVYFLIKVLILSFLFPLHHVIEKGVSTYMVKHQLIRKPKGNFFRRFLLQLYPWMDEENGQDDHH